jgi:ribosomal protein S6--L-glutamate ligase
MNFLILSRLPDIYSTRRLVQEIEDRGHKAHIENPESPCQGLVFDVIIPRIGNFRYEEALANLQKLETHHHPLVTLNSSHFFHHARHKKMASILLAKFPQPQVFATASEFPLVVKDCQSSQGEGVFLCHNKKELDECLYKLQGREVLYQEFIHESQGRDIRAFVLGGKIQAVMERVSKDPAKEFRSNLSLGGRARPALLSPQEEALCIDVVRTLKLDYAGVDFVRSQRGPLILEVNPCPGFEGIENCSHSNIVKEVVLYAESLYRSNS